MRARRTRRRSRSKPDAPWPLRVLNVRVVTTPSVWPGLCVWVRAASTAQRSHPMPLATLTNAGKPLRCTPRCYPSWPGTAHSQMRVWTSGVSAWVSATSGQTCSKRVRYACSSAPGRHGHGAEAIARATVLHHHSPMGGAGRLFPHNDTTLDDHAPPFLLSPCSGSCHAGHHIVAREEPVRSVSAAMTVPPAMPQSRFLPHYRTPPQCGQGGMAQRPRPGTLRSMRRALRKGAP